jgi:hypothetical protein
LGQHIATDECEAVFIYISPVPEFGKLPDEQKKSNVDVILVPMHLLGCNLNELFAANVLDCGNNFFQDKGRIITGRMDRYANIHNISNRSISNLPVQFPSFKLETAKFF